MALVHLSVTDTDYYIGSILLNVALNGRILKYFKLLLILFICCYAVLSVVFLLVFVTEHIVFVLFFWRFVSNLFSNVIRVTWSETSWALTLSVTPLLYLRGRTW
jgi:hypothetical protein